MLRLEHGSVPFAVLPRCGSEAELTATASHEILEAATNPDPARRGFAFRRTSTNLGFTAAGVEPVDPCGIVTMDRHRTEENGFVLQRAWSNPAASRGENRVCRREPTSRILRSSRARRPSGSATPVNG
ncbi:MAG: hypothetical protein ABIT71_08475 [Vicinamibacteraceae bacterium]